MALYAGLYDRVKDKVVVEESAGSQYEEELRAVYAKLRAEADAWHEARLTFMLPRLEAGRHPDTDPTFWQGYVEAAPPSIPSVMASVGAPRGGLSPTAMVQRLAIAACLALFGMIAVAAILLRLIRKGRGKRAVRANEV